MANLREAFEYASQNPDSDFAKNLEQLASSGALNEEAKKYNIDLSPFQPKTEIPTMTQKQSVGDTGLKGVAVGVGKGILSTIKGAGQLGEKIGGAILPEVMTPKSVYSDEATTGGLLDKENLEAQTTAEKIGKGLEQIAEFAVPSTKISKLTQSANLAGKILPRALTSGGVASVQEGDIGKEALIASGVETALPVAGKIIQPATRIVSRLFKGLASGLSGVGTETIEQIVKNPETAKKTTQELLKGGNKDVLQKNAETIVKGVAKIKNEARKSFGDGLESLKSADIDDKVFRQSTQSILDKYGAVLEGGKRQLKNIEFDNPKNITKANEIIQKLQKAKLDGKSLRKLVDDIDNEKFKIATSDERLAFNSFVSDLSTSLKSAIKKSTNKLDEINKAFTNDMQLAESIEQIFGKVKFQNTKEVNKVAQQLETLFSKKGLSPDYMDDFLNRIGIEPEAFKTSEAVRQITNKPAKGLNTPGVTLGEMTQAVTGAFITPKIIRDVAIATGKTEPVIKELLENIAPSSRATLIEALLSIKE